MSADARRTNKQGRPAGENTAGADELFQVDLAYALPYSGSKDAAAILGMVAQKNYNFVHLFLVLIYF